MAIGCLFFVIRMIIPSSAMRAILLYMTVKPRQKEAPEQVAGPLSLG